MRLISTADLTLHTFHDDAIPQYSILSHTWGDEEVTFNELLNPTDEVGKKSGYRKIQKCAEISKVMWGCLYAWVDTCCIDKTSSSELSEAINSMYAWYQNSYICLVYLEDFDGDDFSRVTSDNRCFNRGWTLQELIAPKYVIFYSAAWMEIGDKKNNTEKLKELTTIDRATLLTNQLQNVSVAEKMKWVSHRETTRVEDMSYCMFGIFGVNMPTIYGEGGNAFRRLQEEIMRNLDDATLFLWREAENNPFAHRGALARSPREFRYTQVSRRPLCILSDPFSLTNKGIRVTAKLFKLTERFCREDERLEDAYMKADLRRGNLFALCFKRQIPIPTTSYAILLRRLQPGENQYCRAHPGLLLRVKVSDWYRPKQTFFITERLPLASYFVNLVCRGFAVTVRGRNLKEIVSVSHPETNPHGFQAAFLSKYFPSLGHTTEGCLVLRFCDKDGLYSMSFFDGIALSGRRRKDFESTGIPFRQLARKGEFQDMFIAEYSFRIAKQVRGHYQVRDKLLQFSLSRRHTMDGVLLQVDISVS